MQMTKEILEDQLFLALDRIARDPERAPDDHVDLARAARGLPPDVVDSAFANALARLVADRPPGDDTRCMALIAAEQFAHYAGADRFGPETKAQVAVLLRDQMVSKEREARLEGARARAHLYELQRAVGASTTLAELEAETELRELEPGLWLDLAARELAPDAYLQLLHVALQGRELRPPEILLRLKSLVRLHGAGVAQKALDACCVFLHRYGRYGEARLLIARAERIAPRGWTMPCEDPVAGSLRGFDNASSLIAALEHDLHLAHYPVQVIQRYRIMAIPLFAEDDEDSLSAMHQTFLEIAKTSVGTRLLWTLAFDAEYRCADQNGRDWFAAVVQASMPNLVDLPAARQANLHETAAFPAARRTAIAATAVLAGLFGNAGFVCEPG